MNFEQFFTNAPKQEVPKTEEPKLEAVGGVEDVLSFLQSVAEEFKEKTEMNSEEAKETFIERYGSQEEYVRNTYKPKIDKIGDQLVADLKRITNTEDGTLNDKQAFENAGATLGIAEHLIGVYRDSVLSSQGLAAQMTAGFRTAMIGSEIMANTGLSEETDKTNLIKQIIATLALVQVATISAGKITAFMEEAYIQNEGKEFE